MPTVINGLSLDDSFVATATVLDKAHALNGQPKPATMLPRRAS
ncbi:hypothetical protein EMIT0P171_30261 [Pseudomonas sp. IT-P171]